MGDQSHKQGRVTSQQIKISDATFDWESLGDELTDSVGEEPVSEEISDAAQRRITSAQRSEYPQKTPLLCRGRRTPPLWGDPWAWRTLSVLEPATRLRHIIVLSEIRVAESKVSGWTAVGFSACG